MYFFTILGLNFFKNDLNEKYFFFRNNRGRFDVKLKPLRVLAWCSAILHVFFCVCVFFLQFWDLTFSKNDLNEKYFSEISAATDVLTSSSNPYVTALVWRSAILHMPFVLRHTGKKIFKC